MGPQHLHWHQIYLRLFEIVADSELNYDLSSENLDGMLFVPLLVADFNSPNFLVIQILSSSEKGDRRPGIVILNI